MSIIPSDCETEMEVRILSDELRQLDESTSDGGWPPAVVKVFRKRMQSIRAALDERDLRVMKSHRFEKLKGHRNHQHSMRLNDQWRLILELKDEAGRRIVVIVEITDYH